jgi:mRNA-degrading endonuclease YafQ of YafQ-DinJ toxin-antitoxin module
MLTIQIPKSFLSGFQAIAVMPPEQLQELVVFLQQVPVGMGSATFGKSLDAKFATYSDTALSDAIYSLASFNTATNRTPITELAEALKNSFVVQTNLAEEKVVLQLKDNLVTILNSIENLSATFKAFGLQSENSRTFKECRVVTDIRLLFNDDISSKERKALLVHRLKVKTEENNEEKEYFFSLDTTDLSKLKEQLERAEKKDRLIREQYGDAISFITITE